MRRKPISLLGLFPILSCLAAALALTVSTALGFEDYDGCKSCHGDFRGSTSPKGTTFPSNNNHEMHRSSSAMASACSLCHSSGGRIPTFIGSSSGTGNNPGLGCTGCHVGSGLRAHHLVAGITGCLACHEAESSPAESVKPPYYGTADTKVKNPGNEVQVANTNENWSVGDFIGLDNDGNNLYDLADYAIGPFRLLSAEREGDDLRVTWMTVGGRTNRVQASAVVMGSYSNAGSAVLIPGVGVVTTNFLDQGAAREPAVFYRVSSR